MIMMDFKTVEYVLGRVWLIGQIATAYSYIIKEISQESDD